MGLPSLILGRKGTVCHEPIGLATKDQIEPIIKGLLQGHGHVINFGYGREPLVFCSGPGGIDLVQGASQANQGSKILPPPTDHIVEV